MAEKRIIESGPIEMTCTANVSAVWDLVAGHTGRTVRGNAGYELAKQWSELQSREEVLAHVAAEEFRVLIRKAARLQVTGLVCFRGRGIRGTAPSAEEMGPPPSPEKAGEGRYHQAGKPALYLSDSEEGVRREQDAWLIEGVRYVQRYRLPLDQLVVADFTLIPPDHFATAVFSLAEGCKVSGRGPDSYLFSQTVASIIASAFDGMCVPGVRGDPNFHYSNVVLFHPYPTWQAWLEPGTTPYLL